tara:strand:- start:680 stop:1024 length:345 start_codon:yes stop_codon:yes gene_type:complete
LERRRPTTRRGTHGSFPLAFASYGVAEGIAEGVAAALAGRGPLTCPFARLLDACMHAHLGAHRALHSRELALEVRHCALDGGRQGVGRGWGWRLALGPRELVGYALVACGSSNR